MVVVPHKQLDYNGTVESYLNRWLVVVKVRKELVVDDEKVTAVQAGVKGCKIILADDDSFVVVCCSEGKGAQRNNMPDY